MITLILAVGATLFAQAPPAALVERYSESQTHMGTTFTIQLYAADPSVAKTGFQAAFAAVATCDRAMSDYDPQSELSRLFAGSPHEAPVTVSNDLWRVLKIADQVSRDSEGAFDVTVGPITRLWRQARRLKKLPEQDKLQEALRAVGYQNVRLGPTPVAEKDSTVQLLKSNMRLDLGGIAQGFAAEEALAALAKLGIKQALINASGDLVAGDAPPGETGWKVGIAGLNPRTEKPEFFVYLANGAVSNSGDAYQFTEVDGKRYSHIVDPKTGLGLTTRMSVTLWHKDGTLADALASAVCVLGPEKGMALVDKTPGCAALFILATDDGVKQVKSRNFTQLVKPLDSAD